MDEVTMEKYSCNLQSNAFWQEKEDLSPSDGSTGTPEIRVRGDMEKNGMKKG